MNRKCTTTSLSGKTVLNPANISGKPLCNSEYIPSDVVKIKIYIMTHIIIPLVSKQWKTLQENLFCLDHIKKKLDTYYNCYKIEDMKIYKELINAFEAILQEHQQLEELEKTIYNGDSKHVTTMIYRTAMIRLKPEYEIYDILYGRPKQSENEKYNMVIVEYIERLLKIEGITFHKIKEYAVAKYPETTI